MANYDDDDYKHLKYWESRNQALEELSKTSSWSGSSSSRKEREEIEAQLARDRETQRWEELASEGTKVADYTEQNLGKNIVIFTIIVGSLVATCIFCSGLLGNG